MANWYNFLIFCVLGFGTASKDDSSSRQNGYPQNRQLREAHQTLDKNLGKPKAVVKLCALMLIPPHVSAFLKRVTMFLYHLDEMCGGLSRLKSLGLGLQSEIDNQEDSLDSLLNKVDKMDSKIQNTNQQIKKLK